MMSFLKIKDYKESLCIIKDSIQSQELTSDDINTLVSFFDNERPNYASGQKLELGGILLSHVEIAELTQRQAETLQSEIESDHDVVLFWSKWSAKEYVAQLSQHLQSIISNSVKNIGINTRWIKEGTVAVLEELKIIPKSDDLVYCVDFLTGSGGTLKCLHDLLVVNQIGVQKTLVMIDKPTPDKVFSPPLIDPYMVVDDDYWIFGYGSDCRIGGAEIGRNLPFLACLVPEGQGIRDKLITDI